MHIEANYCEESHLSSIFKNVSKFEIVKTIRLVNSEFPFLLSSSKYMINATGTGKRKAQFSRSVGRLA